MQQADTLLPSRQAPSVFERVIRFIGRPRVSTCPAEPIADNTDWPDSDFDPGKPANGTVEKPVCGGYNEAYIVQYWTSYHLK